jgi:hypothetical protein
MEPALQLLCRAELGARESDLFLAGGIARRVVHIEVLERSVEKGARDRFVMHTVQLPMQQRFI